MTHAIHALLGALALTIAHVPQDPTPAMQAAIARFASAVQATGLSYEKSSSGRSYVVQFDHRGRRRAVYLGLRPNDTSGLLVHSIYTVVWSGAQAPDAATMRKVFTTHRKLGAYYLYQDAKGPCEVRFAAWFDATDLGPETKAGDATAKRLRTLIEFVDSVGAETAQELAK